MNGVVRRQESDVPEWPARAQLLTSAELPQAVDTSDVVGIHCWADWNGHDYEFAKRLKLTTERFPNLVLFTMEIGSNADRMADWQILNVPAFVIFRDGTRLATLWMEHESVTEFQQRIENSLVNASA